MENCFVKQLKGEVNDNSLFRLGEVRVKLTISQQLNLALGSTGASDGQKEYSIDILSEDGYFVDGNTKTYTTSKASETKAVAAATYPCDLILSYVPKKNVGLVGGIFYNTPKSIGEMTDVKQLAIRGFVDDNINMLDLDDLANISPNSLVSFEIPNYNNTGVKTKNLTVLNNFKNLGTLTISGMSSPDNTITLESILNAWFAAGRVSGTLTVNSYNQVAISYNSAILFGTKTFTFSAGGWSENA